jgi:N-acetylmuramic acid 6-phosphate etherase
MTEYKQNIRESLTEKESNYRHLEKMSVMELLVNINREDQKVPMLIRENISSIENLVESIVGKLSSGGRLFYLGAGTSGRLGILDASECPPTFGVDPELVVGLIAGGDRAIRKAVERAEDDVEAGFRDLQAYQISSLDMVIGIAASGRTPYVIGALNECKKAEILTGCITCNPESPMLHIANFPVCIPTGPEFVTGSTRMKAGTAQKLVLNMISTAVMIRLGHVLDNRMVDMQLSNDKLIDRGTRMIVLKSNLEYDQARELLLKFGSVRAVLKYLELLP